MSAPPEMTVGDLLTILRETHDILRRTDESLEKLGGAGVRAPRLLSKLVAPIQQIRQCLGTTLPTLDQLELWAKEEGLL